MEASGIPINTQYQVEGSHGRKEAKDMALSLLQQPDPPTAIFASSDSKAIGVLDAAKILNLHVPGRLSVIGYDNIRDAEYLNLTTIQQPLYQAGMVGGESLLKIVAQPPDEPDEIILPVDLMVRGTTTAPTQ